MKTTTRGRSPTHSAKSGAPCSAQCARRAPRRPRPRASGSPRLALGARDVARVPVDDRRRGGGVLRRRFFFSGCARETTPHSQRCRARSQRCTAAEQQHGYKGAVHVAFAPCRVPQCWTATLGNLWANAAPRTLLFCRKLDRPSAHRHSRGQKSTNRNRAKNVTVGLLLSYNCTRPRKQAQRGTPQHKGSLPAAGMPEEDVVDVPEAAAVPANWPTNGASPAEALQAQVARDLANDPLAEVCFSEDARSARQAARARRGRRRWCRGRVDGFHPALPGRTRGARNQKPWRWRTGRSRG